VSFRHRLLLTALATLAVGLGSLLAAGNLLVARGVRSEASRLLRARADVQVAALSVRGRRVAVRETANDKVLDRQAWVLDGRRVVERPSGASGALDRVALALGARGVAGEREGPGDVRLRAEPVAARGRASAAAVVVGVSVAPLE
jgi:two-component system, OmpR family, heavy metal sensor histidine kinase CusS